MASTASSSALIAIFENRAAARQTIAELRQLGISDTDLGVVSVGQAEEADRNIGAEENTTTGAAAREGAVWGLGIAAGLLPAIGPAIAGGALAGILSNDAAGAKAAAVAGMFLGLGATEPEAAFYESELQSGHTIVTVRPNGRDEEVRAVLRRNGGQRAAPRKT